MAKKLILIIVFLTSGIGSSQIIYVKHNANGLNNGSSWQNAYTQLSTAINNVSLGEIWVAAGSYKPTTDIGGVVPSDPRKMSFCIKSNVEIYGGFNGTETLRSQRDFVANQVIIDGDIGVLGVKTDNVYHVFSCTFANLDRTVLDGLTITNGCANENTVEGRSGGAISIYSANDGNFRLKNCNLTNNHAYGDGGAVKIFNCDVIIENNRFAGNQSFTGGALYLYYSDALVTNNIFEDNLAENFPSVGSSSLTGAAVYIASYVTSKITSNIFRNNYARYKAGAISINSNYPTEISNNLIYNNESRDGGAIYISSSDYFLFNNIIAKNTASWYGGGIYVDYTYNKAEIINNTIIENHANSGGGGVFLSSTNINFVNDIFYGNTTNTSNNGPQIWANSPGAWSPDFSYCDIQGGSALIRQTGTAVGYQNNLDIDPLFVDTSNFNASDNDYQLSQQSALIDAGTTNDSFFPQSWYLTSHAYTQNFPAIDHNGNPRVRGIIDIGAFENQNSLEILNPRPNVGRTYPNPVKDILHFALEEAIERVDIYDISGRKLDNISLINNSINLGNLKKGVYILNLFKEGISTIKILKE